MNRGQWSMAGRNLSRNKRRNLATGVAIGLGFAAFMALGGFITQLENNLRVFTIYGTRVGHITIYKHEGLERYSTKPKQFSLNAAELTKIRQVTKTMPNIELEGAQLLGTGLIGNGCRSAPFLATGIDPELDHKLREHPEMQRWASRLRDVTQGRGLWSYPPELGAVALADGLARILGKTKVYDELPKEHKAVLVTDCLAADAKAKIAADSNVQLVAGSWSGMMSAVDGEVVAHFNSGMSETDTAAMLMPLTFLQKIYDTSNATYYSLWLKDASHLQTVIKDLAAQLKAAGLDADLYAWDDEAVAPFYSGTVQFVGVMTSFIRIVLAAVIILSVFNAATMTVIERSQEIGMMRSMGFTRRHIRQLFVMEMLLLAALAVTAGGVIGALGISAVNRLAILIHPPGIAGGIMLKITPTAGTIALSAALIFTLAVLTTLFAVRSLAKRNIAVLLMGAQR